MKRYYSIFYGGKMLVSITDDMNSQETWAESGVLYTNKKLAKRAAVYWQRHAKNKKVTVKELNLATC